jgi:hypothetical protein
MINIVPSALYSSLILIPANASNADFSTHPTSPLPGVGREITGFMELTNRFFSPTFVE